LSFLSKFRKEIYSVKSGGGGTLENGSPGGGRGGEKTVPVA